MSYKPADSFIGVIDFFAVLLHQSRVPRSRSDASGIRTRTAAMLLLATLPYPGYATAQDTVPGSSRLGAAAAVGAELSRPFVIITDSVRPRQAGRAENVTVFGTYPLNVTGLRIEMRRDGSAASARSAEETAVADEWMSIEPVFLPDSKRVVFTVPMDAPYGSYFLRLVLPQDDGRTLPVMVGRNAGTFSVVAKETPRISAVFPEVSYPEDDRFTFSVIGTGFSPIVDENALIVEKQGRIVTCSSEAGDSASGCARVTASDDGRELRFSGVPLTTSGPLRIRVRVGSLESEPVAITLSPIGRKLPMVVAFVAVALLAILTLWLISRARVPTGAREYTVAQRLLLDAETNTLSLSKLQLYLWTVAGLLGYAYLSIARSWVQGVITFADLPERFPAIILMSAGTSALALGITSSRGSKGAGHQEPAWSDLVTSGGVVAADRLQFLIWTIVGVSTFVVLAFSVDPGRITALPDVPETFLTLMGISSFGYLGAKLGRKPGPVVAKIEAMLGSLVLRVSGSHLSPDATFFIGSTEVKLAMPTEELRESGRPEILVPQSDGDKEFAKVMRLNIPDPRPEWLRGAQTLTIVNPDKQRASFAFEIAPSPFSLTDESGELPEKRPPGSTARIAVRATNADGAGVSGIRVTFAVDPEHGALPQPTPKKHSQVTPGDGIARIAWTLPSKPGKHSITVEAFEPNGRPLEGSPMLIPAFAEANAAAEAESQAATSVV